jgi:hypothetical protein
MNKIIRLKECKELALKIALDKNNARIGQDHHYKTDSIIRAVEILAKDDLRVDNTTGTMYNNTIGWLEKFSNPADFEPFESIEDVCIWDFARNILNEAGRIERQGSSYKYWQ